jgi:hypothetical protein
MSSTRNTRICNGPCARTLELEANFYKDRTRGGYKAKCKVCSSKSKGVASLKVTRGDFNPEGRAEPHGPAPEGYILRGRSTLYNKDGAIIGEWVKTAKDKEEELKQMLKALEAFSEGWDRPKAIKKPKGLLADDLLTVIPLGDPHLGMFSWHQETGQDFDLDIAASNLFAAVDHLVGLAPKSKQALLVNLGDFFHMDNSSNQTTRGTRVDVDSRWAKVLQVGIKVMRRCIDRLLETHEKVTVINAIGNHDSHSAIMLALALDQFYADEPRVTIDTSPAKFHWYRFGKNLIGVTHGDTVKAKDLPGVMAVDRAKDWGETDYRYWLCGHVHHDTLKEMPGVTIETFRTLAPADAWHKGQGYRSGQDLKLDVYHRKYGRVNRHVVGIQQVWDLE